MWDLYISQFNSAFTVSFLWPMTNDARFKFDSGVISPNQSHFFVLHNNPWVFCILYRQYLTSNCYFLVCQSEERPNFRVMSKSNLERFSKWTSFLFKVGFCIMFLPHFDAISDLLLNKRTATWNLLDNFIISVNRDLSSNAITVLPKALFSNWTNLDIV